MSIFSNNKNVTLTLEQMQQIEEATTRLRNIESEIVIANRNLGIENKEVVKATKERMYQEELLAGLLPKVEDAKKNLSDINSSIADGIATLDTIKRDKDAIEKDTADKRIELESRATNIVILEKELKDRKDEYSASAEKLANDQLLVEKAKEAFIAAADSVVWK